MNSICLIEVDKSLSEFSDKLKLLMKNKGYEVNIITINEYGKEKSASSSKIFDESKFVFIGKDKSVISKDLTWKLDKYNCRIGWKGDICEIFASEENLPFDEYKRFKIYCEGVRKFYPDAIVPPSNQFKAIAERMKEFFGTKNANSIHRAQYSTLVYEFTENYFDEFINSECDETNNRPFTQEQDDLMGMLKKKLQFLKNNALNKMSIKETLWCHIIIHVATLACAAVAFIPIPVMDAIPMTAAQITMVLALAEVFDNKISKSDAEILLKAAAAPLAGRALAKSALNFVPGVGWTMNSAIAVVITEILGWSIANDFASKKQW